MTSEELNASPGGEIRVMLVDDSAVIRGLIARALESDKGIRVVSSVSNGQMAIAAVKGADPDIVVLDIEMPVMDGLTALPKILEASPGVKVLVCSNLSRKGAAVSVRALALGAAECLVKPTSTGDMNGAGEFQKNLLQLIHALGRKGAHAPSPAPGGEGVRRPAGVQENARKTPAYVLRRDPHAWTGKPALVAIGSSTGGPQALFTLLKSFKDFDVPIVITQHMPKTFTAILAEHIHTNCGLDAFEGANGMVLQKGNVYVAPGGFHMEFEKTESGTVIRLSDAPPENYCKPSVEPMMRSAIKIYGNRILAVMLTGMGSDGLESFRQLAEKGGRIVAQDEKTSIVWGMPGAVAVAGLCTQVLPLMEIGPWVRRAVLQ